MLINELVIFIVWKLDHISVFRARFLSRFLINVRKSKISTECATYIEKMSIELAKNSNLRPIRVSEHCQIQDKNHRIDGKKLLHE